MVLKLDRSFLMVCYVFETLGIPKIKLPHPQAFTLGMGKVPPETEEGRVIFLGGPWLPRGLLPRDVFTKLLFQPCVLLSYSVFDILYKFPLML